MKLKLKLDQRSIQEFFLYHVEKIVLGVVVLLLGIFVFLGTQLEGSKELTSPEKLDRIAKDTTVKMNNPAAWTQLSKDRTVDYNVPDRVKEDTLRSIAPESYVSKQPWNPTDWPRLKQRTDPKIYPPQGLMVVAIQGPLGIRRADATAGTGPVGRMTDPLSGDGPGGNDPTARPDTATRPSPERPERPGPPGARPKAPGAGKGRDRTPQPGLESYEPYGMEDYGGPVEGSRGSGGPNQVGVRQRREGFLPSNDGSFAAGRAVVVMAVVPWEKQYDEFQRAFAESLDYQPERDFPRYVFSLVERADVTDNPNAAAAELKWQKLSTQKLRDETFKWMGFPAEVLDPDYLDRVLTHPAPPFFFRDLTNALTYPNIPRLEDSLATELESGPGRAPVRKADVGADEFDGPSSNPMPGEAGFMNPGRMAPGTSNIRTRAPFVHQQAPAAGAVGPPDSMRVNVGLNGNVAKALADSVRKFKLLRITDTTIEPNKIYRYRLKVLVEDPNRPETVSLEPLVQSLHPDVKARLAKTQNANKRIFYVDSEWSEASPPVRLPPVEDFYAAEVDQPKMNFIRDDRPLIADKEISGKILTVLWSDSKAVDVPAVQEVHRASALNFSKEAEVVHPLSMNVRKLADYEFLTNAVVADMRGGETIKARNNRDDDALKTPGELLVFDSRGNWHVLDESEDCDAMQRHAPEDAKHGEPTAPPRTRVPPRNTRPTPQMQPYGPEGAMPKAGNRRGGK